jgi:transposase
MFGYGMDAPVIQQGYRIALRPTAEQEQFLAACAGASRFWFNQGLALVKDLLERRAGAEDVDVPWSYRALCIAFRGDAKKDQLAPWRKQVVTGSYQAGLDRARSRLRSAPCAACSAGWSASAGPTTRATTANPTDA